MKKILIACRGYYPHIAGGGEISTKKLAEELSSLGYDVHVLAVDCKDKDDLIENVKVSRVKFKNIYWSMGKEKHNPLAKLIWHIIDSNNIFFESKLTELLERIKPDVLITSTIEDVSSIIWRVAYDRRIRTLHILRSYSLLCKNANMYKEDNCISQCASCRTLTLMKKTNSQYVNDVVGISKYVLEKHIENGYFRNAKAHVIYNMCIDEIVEKRKLNGFQLPPIKLGYLGRIHKTKGIELIITAVSKLKKEQKDKIIICIAGTGEPGYINELNMLSVNFGLNIKFYGNVKPTLFLDDMDMLIVPSKWNEPFGRVIVESLGRGVPVAGKKVGGIPELLNDNKDFLFDIAEELTEIISLYLIGNIEFNFQLEKFETKNILEIWGQVLDKD
ncbi:TPA: glycosyltransferase [Klebsiella pneumoniae]|nr:glycosyltransferase [Klebsiella pneumoniae]